MTDQISTQIRSVIDTKLDAIERNENVRILFAIESGSRAWGFPSPNSDYDVRFVYVHDPEWYLSIDKRRDVIELPLEGDLDINGWDLKKALSLLIKPNPVLLEWLRSPIVYRADSAAVKALLALGTRAAHLRPSTHHYLRLAETQFRRSVAGKDSVAMKKYFYSLRPALALRWMRVLPQKPLPMDLPTLLAGVGLSKEASDAIDELIQRKAETNELGRGPPVNVIDSLISNEIEIAKAGLPELPAAVNNLVEDANNVFRELIRRREIVTNSNRR